MAAPIPNHPSPVWRKAIREAADPPRVEHYLKHLGESTQAGVLSAISAEQARVLAALFSGSPASADLVVKHPDWMSGCLNLEELQYARREDGLRREISTWLQAALKMRDYAGAASRLREFKQREMVRIAARDLAQLDQVPILTREISAVADVCLSAILEICLQPLLERLGQPHHQDADGRWQPTEFAVIGLGKLGGHELNYSSDVDVMFVYSEEGQVFKAAPGKAAAAGQPMTNHQFFKRLAEAFIAEVSRTTPQGMLFRIDLRLRPEGDAGPLVRSLNSYENFYAQWGQPWERMMLIKARGVAGSPALAAEFVEMVQPFRYPRSLSGNFLQEIAGMKDRLETEVVKAGEIERNVKLGRGGIREIEFIAQSLQVVHAGRIPFLQGPQTLPVLDKLVQYHYLTRDEARGLTESYCFLRNIEHRLQMEQYFQTHTIPASTSARTRLAALMGFKRLAEFEASLRRYTSQVRQVYDKFLKPEQPASQDSLPRQFEGAEAEWKMVLAAHNFKDVEKSYRLLAEFAQGPGYVHVSSRTVELAMQLIPRLLALCPKTHGENPSTRPSAALEETAPPARVMSDPDRVLTRLDSFISAYGARSMMFETWSSNPALFELLLLLFDRSEFLAEVAIRTPDLVDDLVLSGRLSRRKSTEEVLRDLRYGKKDKDQRLWLRRYHQAEQMRLGLREILGLADCEQNQTELSALADACLQYALEVALAHHGFKTSPLAIIGLGKVGGQEINYGSDLDITFVAATGAKGLPKLQRVAAEVLEMLSAPTELGVAFATDTRLRPDGEKGLLVNTLAAYEDYYRRRAQLWEIQALSRARPVAGNLALGGEFQRLAHALTDFSPENVNAGFPVGQLSAAKPGRRATGKPPKAAAVGLVAYSPDWRRQIARMRQRIEKERTPKGQDHLAIKTGRGGLVDAEFIAQALNLEHGWHEANTRRALERARDAGVIPPAEAAALIENFRLLLQVECILRRWSFAGEVVLPDHPAPLYRVSVRCGYPHAEAFMQALADARARIRAVYDKVFPEPP